MKLLHLTPTTATTSYAKPTLELSIESYDTQVQPLTELMVEIITFQQKELALFADFELHANSLN